MNKYLILIGMILISIISVNAWSINSFNNSNTSSFETGYDNGWVMDGDGTRNNGWASDGNWNVRFDSLGGQDLYNPSVNLDNIKYLVVDYNSSTVNSGLQLRLCTSCGGSGYTCPTTVSGGIYGTNVSTKLFNLSSYSGIKCLNLHNGGVFGGGSSFNFIQLDNVRIMYDSDYQIESKEYTNLGEYQITESGLISTNVNTAQTFTIGTVSTNAESTLEKIQIRACSSDTLTLGLRATDSGGLPTGSDLITSYPLSVTSGSYSNFTFPSIYKLQPSTKYAFVISSPTNYCLYRNSANAYLGGTRFLASGLTWANQSDDLYFKVYLNQDIIRYLSIPQNTILTNAFLNLSGSNYSDLVGYNGSGLSFIRNSNSTTTSGTSPYAMFNALVNWLNSSTPTNTMNVRGGEWITTYNLTINQYSKNALLNTYYSYGLPGSAETNSFRFIASIYNYDTATWEEIVSKTDSTHDTTCNILTNSTKLKESYFSGNKITLKVNFTMSADSGGGGFDCDGFFVVGTWSPVHNNYSISESYPTNSSIKIGSFNSWNYIGILNTTNKTNNLANIINSYLSTCTYLNGFCLVPFIFHSDTAGIIDYNNLVFNNNGIIVNNEIYNNNTLTGSTETFSINLTTQQINSASLIYNGNTYPVDSISYIGSGIYILNKSIVVPNVNSLVNKTFYWSINALDGVYNSTAHNQTVNPLQVDNCTLYTNVLLNYVMYDEQTNTIIPDSNTPNTNVIVTVYASDYSTLIANYTTVSTSNNTKICINNLTNSNSYLMDVQTLYNGGSAYQPKYYYIQKHTITNTTTNINLYTVISANTTEFTVYFKDSNFLPKGNVLVNVDRQFPDGTFKTVEIARTDNQGVTLVHLTTSTVLYNLVFTYNGELLTILSNVLAKCSNPVLQTCDISVNSYSSNLNLPDFNYVNGINVIQTNTNNSITSTFTSNSGTNNVTMIVTLLDNFGNTTICTNSIISSSGSITCNIPTTYQSSTIISDFYSNGILSDRKIITMNMSNPDSSGSVIILALLVVITLSLLFITDIRGVLIGCFLGLILAGTLLYINQGNLFSAGSAIMFAITAGGIILWKINSNEGKYG